MEMAEETTAPKAPAAKRKPAAKPKPAAAAAAAETEDVGTKRVVLKRERVIVLPDAITAEKQKALAAALGLKVTQVPVAEAWVVCGEFSGNSKDHAIEAHAGKPGTPDAKVGAYRAPTVRAWQGGVVYTAPPKPLVEKAALD